MLIDSRLLVLLALLGFASPGVAADPKVGEKLYREHTKKHPLPLIGDKSVDVLTKVIDKTTPEDDPDKLDAAQSADVAAYLNSSLAKLYGTEMPPEAGFSRVVLNAGNRAGVITHPYLLATFAYASESSPIHRGVFLACGILGVTLRPPQDAFTPFGADLHPTFTTRERNHQPAGGARGSPQGLQGGPDREAGRHPSGRARRCGGYGGVRRPATARIPAAFPDRAPGCSGRALPSSSPKHTTHYPGRQRRSTGHASG